MLVETPTCDLLYRFVREREGRETTEEGPRKVKDVEESGCETMKTSRNRSWMFERRKRTYGGLNMGGESIANLTAAVDGQSRRIEDGVTKGCAGGGSCDRLSSSFLLLLLLLFCMGPRSWGGVSVGRTTLNTLDHFGMWCKGGTDQPRGGTRGEQSKK